MRLRASLLVAALGCASERMEVPPPLAGDGGSCVFEGEKQHPPLSDGSHVASTANVTYNSNPPSSGPHCGQLGSYRVYPPDRPLDRCNWLHNLEHGAVALLYNCPEGCPDVVDALANVLATAARDPDCSTRRILLTPYPLLDTRLAAAAWGFTWKSDCLDAAARASLSTFISTHLGSRGIAPEKMICN